eukprot:TRINITY_DN808_c1_g1_i2.p1 TRINITY_DN808_c1_g1~~TRINITY_DN808_c1_g1_i2.p1  ORF type:complete len:616 (+),score=194.20 TRINITY_DN808_c1_g1_i2:240-1850(+)
MGLLETILNVHYNDFGALFSRTTEEITLELLCKSFSLYPSNIGAFNSFCGNELDCAMKISSQKESNHIVAEILSAGASNTNTPVTSFLSLPYQRLNIYPVVLTEVGFLINPDTPQFQQLKETYEKLTTRVDAIKDAKWGSESLKKMIEMVNSIEGLENTFLNPSRRFILDSDITKFSNGKTQKRKYYLINDLLLECKEIGHNKYSLSSSYEIDFFRIEDEPQPKGTPTQSVFKVIYTEVETDKKKKKESNTFFLCFESEGEKALWARKIIETQERFFAKKDENDAAALMTALIDPAILQVNEQVGEGASGVVFRGIYRGDKVVAIKKMKNAAALTKAERDSFISEVQILKTFQCPQIVEFVGCVMTPTDLWLVSEFITHGTLKSFITNHQLATKLKVLFLLDIAKGLEYLHKHSIMHRDIKSDNVLVADLSIDSVSRVKLTDFGASRMVKDKIERNYTRIGTPIYVSPEVMKGEPYGFSTDVYSFSILMWEVMAQQVLLLSFSFFLFSFFFFLHFSPFFRSHINNLLMHMPFHVLF